MRLFSWSLRGSHAECTAEQMDGQQDVQKIY
jgi:hypothetical protein